jgi:hypothetical protein
MAFHYDVFISYSSEDREWASRLNQALTTSPITLLRLYSMQAPFAPETRHAR